MFRPSLLAALFLSALTTPALAQASPWYLGLSLGQSKTGDDLVTNRESTVVNAAVVGSDFDAEDGAAKIFAGYNFTRHLAVELGYSNLGSTRLRTNIVNQGQGGSVTLHRKLSGWSADILARLPIGQRAAFFGRLGTVRLRLDAEAELDGNIIFAGAPLERSRRTRQSEAVTHAGLGADWDLGRGLGLRVEWERWFDVGKAFAIGGSGTTGEADTDFYSVGLTYRF
ncbi:MAG TPA: outer membrane beta-barrel protein [Usitatibacter sp.]|nr:outer membrane beta-barrel protein [Usitatibacter sp.]